MNAGGVILILGVILISIPIILIASFISLRSYQKAYPEEKVVLYGLGVGLLEILLFITLIVFGNPSKGVSQTFWLYIIFLQPLLTRLLGMQKNVTTKRIGMVLLAASFVVLLLMLIIVPLTVALKGDL